MKRGSLVTVAVQGDYGKPRPAVVIQSNAMDDADSVLLCLLTSALRDAPLFRLTLEPDARNGLQARSQVMVDKIMAVRRDRCGPAFGRIDDAALLSMNRLLALIVGSAD